ncbi:MAG: hypothetical protein GX558_05860, partial [Clostridiales bacterium]|nr:hypothetical protein [Clostridiales bacterium]
ECEALQADDRNGTRTPSFASRQWTRDGARYIRALGQAIEAHGLQNNIFGYLVGCGDSAEWVKGSAMEDWAADYSPAMQAAFSVWLRAKYGDDYTLRQAWGDPNATLDNPLPVPAPEEQATCDLFLFKNPRRRRKAVDYFQCLAHESARGVAELCGAAKNLFGRAHLAGVFYGYLQELVWSDGFFGQGDERADTAHTALARSGHTGLSEVLACPDVDFLSSPVSYCFRGVGGEAGPMAPYESVRRAGKLWISEEDIRTHTWTPDNGFGLARDAAQTCQIIKRQMGGILTAQNASWWCDWAGDHDGAFNDPQLMEIFRRFVQLGEQSLHWPERGSQAEIAVVIDPESYFYRSTLNNFDIANWQNRPFGFARLGAPVDYLLLADVLAGRCGAYKMYCFVNAFHLGAEDRRRLTDIVRRDGRLSLWIYAPGFADDERLDPALAGELIGMRLRMYERQWSCRVFLSDFEHPVTRTLPSSTFWGTDQRIGPLFVVDDPDARTLGLTLTYQGRSEPGFALAERDGYRSAYSSAPFVPPGVLRELARYAGAHIWAQDEDVFMAGGGFVMLHTLRAGEKALNLPCAGDVYDAFSGQRLARDTLRCTVALAAQETRLLRVCAPGARPWNP